jgi:hypothetical protein
MKRCREELDGVKGGQGVGMKPGWAPHGQFTSRTASGTENSPSAAGGGCTTTPAALRTLPGAQKQPHRVHFDLGVGGAVSGD